MNKGPEVIGGGWRWGREEAVRERKEEEGGRRGSGRKGKSPAAQQRQQASEAKGGNSELNGTWACKIGNRRGPGTGHACATCLLT